VGHLRLVSLAPPVPTPESACLSVFERELEYIFATLRRLGASPHEVEDLVQEVFVVLHRNWHTLDTTRPLRPYLSGIAFRIVAAQRRRRAREVLSVDFEISDGALGPEGSLQTKQAVELLLAALDAVPLARRAVVIMHDLDEIPIVEVARSLSITRFGAYARLRQGRSELKAAVRRLLRGISRV
jgi:RNA polymerase sigma-70 factor, ECF subfamily